MTCLLFLSCPLPQQGHCLQSVSLCICTQVTLVGEKHCLNSVFIVEKVGWSWCLGGRANIKAGESTLYTVAALAQCMAHGRCSINARWIKKGRNERLEGALSWELNLMWWTVRLRWPARVWPPNFGFVKNDGLLGAWWSWRQPTQGPDLGSDLSSSEFPLGSPLFGTAAFRLVVSHLAGWLTQSHLELSFLPCHVSKSQAGAFSNGLCISWYPQGRQDVGRTDNECVSGDPLKCQACLCWQVPGLLHSFKEMSPMPAGPRLGLWAFRTHCAEAVVQSTLHFQEKKKMLKHDVGCVYRDNFLIPKDKQ